MPIAISSTFDSGAIEVVATDGNSPSCGSATICGPTARRGIPAVVSFPRQRTSGPVRAASDQRRRNHLSGGLAGLSRGGQYRSRDTGCAFRRVSTARDDDRRAAGAGSDVFARTSSRIRGNGTLRCWQTAWHAARGSSGWGAACRVATSTPWSSARAPAGLDHRAPASGRDDGRMVRRWTAATAARSGRRGGARCCDIATFTSFRT